MKNQKGVNLVSLSVAVIVIIAIVGTVLYNVRTNLGVHRLKAMQADIENLRGKVTNYYLQYGALPTLNVYDGEIKLDTTVDKSILQDVINNTTNNATYNELDTSDFFVIDLEVMDNMTLSYGEDYENLKNESAETIKTLGNGTLTDVYIINSVSHNIFYVGGITYEGNKYYTQYQDEEKSKVGESNTDIDINVEKRNNKVLLEIKKGEKAPENRNAIYKDTNNNEAIIPAGFTVSDVEGESLIETGLVIRDDDENEFVWIPVGIQWKSDPSKTIELSRYTFDSDGIPTKKGADVIDSKYIELESSTRGNVVAKNINDYITKTNAARGFWIGRYEARIEGYKGTIIKSNFNKKISWTGYTGGKLVEKPGVQVFNYITQNKASELSKTMYEENNYFESDLINGYAWDTAILFLQEYDNRTSKPEVYSRQNSINTGSPLATGTVSETNKDKICNVYDMASNCSEWTTETCNHYDEWTDFPCMRRGGHCNYSGRYSSGRNYDTIIYAEEGGSFRPILYIK